MFTIVTPELVAAYRDDLRRLASDRHAPSTSRRWFDRHGRRDR